jgi:ABC-2 type transport system permease protein
MLLWIATFTSGQYLLTTTIEEKSNKVMEVLLSAVSPMQLLGGKILGQAGVSAVILLMYGSAVMAGLLAFALGDLVPVLHLVLFAIYFVIAYFMIATIMAAVGSAVNELRDAQSLMGPIMLVMVIPMIIWPVLSEHPNGMLATITSFTPPLLPFVMILRVTASTEPIAIWQIVLSIGVGIVSVVAMIWMCARIFRIGVLMQGKPPSILQLAKWIRQG